MMSTIDIHHPTIEANNQCAVIAQQARPSQTALIVRSIPQKKKIQKAKIEHYLSKEYSSRGDDSEHLFTFPFVTSDNSLHTCSEGLTELDSLRDRGLIHDGMYMKNNLIESNFTVINASSVGSISPGANIDGNVLDFCLSW